MDKDSCVILRKCVTKMQAVATNVAILQDILADERHDVSREISNNHGTASWKASHLVQDCLDPFLCPECYTELEKFIPGVLLEYLLILIFTHLGKKNGCRIGTKVKP